MDAIVILLRRQEKTIVLAMTHYPLESEGLENKMEKLEQAIQRADRFLSRKDSPEAQAIREDLKMALVAVKQKLEEMEEYKSYHENIVS